MHLLKIFLAWVINDYWNIFLKVITGSADKTIKIFDVLSGFKQLTTLKAAAPVDSLETIYNLTLAGCGDGNVLCFDNDHGNSIYG